MTSITRALANSLKIDDYKKVVNKVEKSRSLTKSSDTKPIVQLNAFPVSIDANNYKNARSTSNPSGDLRPLFAFRQLVDPIPNFGQVYIASTSSTETLFNSIVNGASTPADSDFSASVISQSKKMFALNTFSNMDGTPGEWRPIYAVPEDWPSAANSRFSDLSIDVHKTEPSDSFGVISEDKQLDWILEGGKRKTLNPNTQINSIKMKHLLVGLQRPWFNSLLFQTGDWYLSCEDAGFCSSGLPTNNDGVFPLIPTSMLIGKQIVVNASWSKEDQAIIDSYKSTGKSLSLGPFPIADPEDNSIKIIGWITELIPFSPQISKPVAACVKVDNKGAFIARFSVTWKVNGVKKNHSSGVFPVLANKEIEIPAFATDIVINIDIMTFPKPFETWSTVKTVQLEKPVVLEYELSGTTFDPKVNEKSGV
jgi:hypothetical protein